jgi:hypothetical protein
MSSRALTSASPSTESCSACVLKNTNKNKITDAAAKNNTDVQRKRRILTQLPEAPRPAVREPTLTRSFTCFTGKKVQMLTQLGCC